MANSSHVTEYQFILPTEDDLYCMFPVELEEDEHVFFHGTLDARRLAIIAEGFLPGPGQSGVSYAGHSNGALDYACKKRSTLFPDGCIFAVRFHDLQQRGIAIETFGLHVYNLQPKIIGYCIIPSSYSHR